MDFYVEANTCTRCGLCAADCPKRLIILNDLPELTDAKACINCQHCLTICPQGAIQLGDVRAKDCPPLEQLPSPDSMERLLAGRRSLRRFKKEEVDGSLLRRVADAAWNAPCGGNAHKLLISLVDRRQDMIALREEVYARLAELVEHGRLPAVKLRPGFMRAPELWSKGVDWIFRDAPHLVMVSAAKDSVCPVEDPLIYLSQFEMAAQCHGLGTLWCGIFHYCLDLMPDLVPQLGVPTHYRPSFTMLLGWPAVRYSRCACRGPAALHQVRW